MSTVAAEHDTVVITGGASGLGYASAERILADWPHVHVALLDRQAGRAPELVERFGAHRVHTITTDVADAASVSDAFADVVAWRGGFSGLVAAAGFATNRASVDLTAQEWREMVGCHLDGTFFSNQAAGRHWIHSGRSGAIVNFSSVAHIFGWPRRLGYAAAKAGIDSITRTLAVEWAEYGIRVNAVVPGYINTPMLQASLQSGAVDPAIRTMHAMERFGEPTEIAAGVKFLLSSDASFITGELLTIDGGFSARRIPWRRD